METLPPEAPDDIVGSTAGAGDIIGPYRGAGERLQGLTHDGHVNEIVARFNARMRTWRVFIYRDRAIHSHSAEGHTIEEAIGRLEDELGLR